MQKLVGVWVVVLVLMAETAMCAENVLEPVGDGIKKILKAPLEIPKSIAEDADEQNIVTGVVTGTVKGTAKGVQQIGEGTADAVGSVGNKAKKKKTNLLDKNAPYDPRTFEPWMDQEDKYDDIRNFDASQSQ